MAKLSNAVIEQIQSLQLGAGVSFVQPYDTVNNDSCLSLPHHSVKTWKENHSLNEFGHALHFKTDLYSVFVQAPKLNVDMNGMDCSYSHIYAQNLETGEWTDFTETRWSGVEHSSSRMKFSEIENIFLNTKRNLAQYGIELPESYVMVIALSVFGEINKELITANSDHLVFKISQCNLFTQIIGNHQSYTPESTFIEISPRLAIDLKSKVEDSKSSVVYQDENIVLIDTRKEKYGLNVLTSIYRSADSNFQRHFVYQADPNTCIGFDDRYSICSEVDQLKFFNAFIRDMMIETRLMEYSNSKGECDKVIFKNDLLVALAQYIGLEYKTHELCLPTDVIEALKKHDAYDDTLAVDKLITEINLYNPEIFKDRMNWFVSLSFLLQLRTSKTVKHGYDYFANKLQKNPEKSKFNDEFYIELLDVA